MINRLKAILADFFQQADLMLLGLCSSATVFGILLIFSATQYKRDSRYVIIQTVALLLGICVYIGFSMVDLEILMKKWKWVLAFNVANAFLSFTFMYAVSRTCRKSVISADSIGIVLNSILVV